MPSYPTTITGTEIRKYHDTTQAIESQISQIRTKISEGNTMPNPQRNRKEEEEGEEPAAKNKCQWAL